MLRRLWHVWAIAILILTYIGVGFTSPEEWAGALAAILLPVAIWAAGRYVVGRRHRRKMVASRWAD